ncbi:MAG: hypothetical protein IPJ69_07805 [Deltaproteobacteria bacterium]|nr:MAG: hypothetical protein IPJ69_07805 [Deltaproteobacteria bacterium]
MGVFQEVNQLYQQSMDMAHRPIFDAMHLALGDEAIETLGHAAMRFENGMELVAHEPFNSVTSAAQWVGTQVSDVIERLNAPSQSLQRCYVPVETDRPRINGSVSVNFYGGNASYYPVFYQCNSMLFFSAVSSCWQMGIDPFLNPYMLMQMLMMLMMQQNMMFMNPFLIPQSFGIGIFLSLNPGLRFL